MTIETQVTHIEAIVNTLATDTIPNLKKDILAAVAAKTVDSDVAAFNAKLDEISGDEKTILAQLIEPVAEPVAEPIAVEIAPATPVEEPAAVETQAPAVE